MKKANAKIVIYNALIYTASGLLLRCFSFFLLPLYTAYLTTEDYGIISLAASFIETAAFVVAFSLFSAVMRFYVDLKEDSKRLKRFYGTVSLFVFLSSIFFGVILTVFYSYLSRFIFAGVPYYPVIFVSLVALVFHCQQVIFDTILRSQQQAKKSSLISIAFFIFNAVLTIVFICIFKLGAVGVIAASGIAYFVCTACLVIYMLRTRQISYCLDIALLKDALRYSLPIMPHNLSTHIALLASQILVGDVISLGSLGIYSVASKFGNLADTIQVYIDRAYGPWFYEVMHGGGEDLKNNLRKTVQLLISCIGLAFLVLALFSHDCIVLFLNKNYVEAWKYVPCIILVFAIKTMYYFYVEILFYYKKASKYLFTATVTGSTLNIILSFFLIPIWGIVGAVLANAISMLVRVIIVVVISKRFADIGLYVRDFILNFITIAVFMAVGLSFSYLKFSSSFNILNFGFKIFVVLMYSSYAFFKYRKHLLFWIMVIREKYRHCFKNVV
ncbi:MAG: polysaccharide biosynthesis protein [Acidaminococcaceae bacterium]|nr:polysaccharide biosynthesis protein [Acidaminococcaceae bacterium]